MERAWPSLTRLNFLNFQGICKQNFRTFLPFTMLKIKSDPICLVVATASQNRHQLLCAAQDYSFENRHESKKEHSDYEDQLVLFGSKWISEVGNQEDHDPPRSWSAAPGGHVGFGCCWRPLKRWTALCFSSFQRKKQQKCVVQTLLPGVPCEFCGWWVMDEFSLHCSCIVLAVSFFLSAKNRGEKSPLLLVNVWPCFQSYARLGFNVHVFSLCKLLKQKRSHWIDHLKQMRNICQ